MLEKVGLHDIGPLKEEHVNQENMQEEGKKWDQIQHKAQRLLPRCL